MQLLYLISEKERRNGGWGVSVIQNLFQAPKEFFFLFCINMVLADSVGLGVGCVEDCLLSSSDLFKEPLMGFR